MDTPRGELGYDRLEHISRTVYGRSFRDYLSEVPVLGQRLTDEATSRTLLSEWIGQLRVGDPDGVVALYTLYAGERSLHPQADGYSLESFSAMNVSHRIASSLLDELLSNGNLDSKGGLHGTGTVAIAHGPGDEPLRITVDFDAGTVRPRIRIGQGGRFGQEVTAADVAEFVRLMHRFRGTDDPRISIFLQTLHLPTLRHEILHALYSTSAEYRGEVRERVRGLDSEARDYAVLFSAMHYDVLNPAMARRNADIVLDEAFNAYLQLNGFDPASGGSIFSIGDFMRRQEISLSLSAWRRIDDLPVSSEERRRLTELYEGTLAQVGGMSEELFLQHYSARSFDNLYCLRLLRTLLIEQQPEIYARVLHARKHLIDVAVAGPVDSPEAAHGGVE